jgi:methyl-accepting chemotaxis protein
VSARVAEETREQAERVAAAAEELKNALHRLSDEAKAAARRAGTKRAQGQNIAPVIGAFRTVERADEALSIALYDYDTARGEDG